MQSKYRYLTSFLLSATLASPLAVAQQDERRGDDQRQEQNQNNRDNQNQQRVYDRSHHDYHQWNDSEDHAYRQYLTENHKEYRDFQSASGRQQSQYWKWRHAHGDHDDQSDHDRH
jgi:hypothetical protein